jgi:hypothetical protein
LCEQALLFIDTALARRRVAERSRACYRAHAVRSPHDPLIAVKPTAALLVVSLLCAPMADGAKPCEELALEIAAKLTAAGIKDYSLEIVSNELAEGEKVVGSCEGGTRKITYARVRAQKPDAPASAPKN